MTTYSAVAWWVNLPLALADTMNVNPAKNMKILPPPLNVILGNSISTLEGNNLKLKYREIRNFTTSYECLTQHGWDSFNS